MISDEFQQAVKAGVYGLLIDDTGSPGVQANNPNLPKETKSLVGVLVPPHAMPVIADQLPGVIDEIRSITGANEMHFVDIYGARKNWKGVDPKVRLGIFGFMSWIFDTYGLKLIVQSFTAAQHQDVISRLGIDNAGPFDLKKIEDAALLFLLIQAKWHLKSLSHAPGAKAGVFIDAGNGWKRSDSKHQVNIFSDVFMNGEFGFYDSAKMPPIQIADFAAFFHNRVNLIINKVSPELFDRQLVEILQPLQTGYLNIPTLSWDVIFPEFPSYQ
jgi:hypothetical protein